MMRLILCVGTGFGANRHSIECRDQAEALEIAQGMAAELRRHYFSETGGQYVRVTDERGRELFRTPVASDDEIGGHENGSQ